MVAPRISGRPPRGMRWVAVGQAVLWSAIGLGAFLLLAKSVQNSAEFGRLQIWILVVDVCGVIALTVLITRQLWRLVRDYRAHVPGSRLTARTVGIFGALVIAPLLIVYLSSLEFINVGIDSWFKVEVKQGLSDALGLSRAALDLRMREYSHRTVALAATLASASSGDMQSQLNEERRASQALEIALFGPHERIIAASLENPLDSLPAQPPADLVRQVGQQLPYVSLEPQADGRYLIRTAASLGDAGSQGSRFVVAIYPVPAQLAALSEAVQSSYNKYGDLAAIREPLKYSFRLTLTLVVLLAMLAAIYGAIYSAQRLVRPVQDLIAGTRAVGKGDFATRLPLPSRDEMGFLVHSFNDMTKRLRRARAEATHSQQAVERERERLAIILSRLSTGVLAIDHNMTVRMAHAAAGRRRPGARCRNWPRATSGWGSSWRRWRCASRADAKNGASRSTWTAAADGARSCAPARRCRVRIPTWALSSYSMTSPRSCRRSAMRPGARWRDAWRTKSKTPSRPSSCPPSACGGACSTA